MEMTSQNLCVDTTIPTRTVKCFPNNKSWNTSVLKKLLTKNRHLNVVKGLCTMILRAMLSGALAPCRVSHGKLPLGAWSDLERFMDSYDIADHKKRQTSPSLWRPGHPPGATFGE
ncbi:hypothetical protein CRENBAI_002710 [Crenichthys baileyi]|uniref:Uncharacterized protein n=1 Tax=Crenichthys baileyi TaxID=28760 RepID=A0AAV9RVX0_9TELE